jgi:hypothetical protein
MYGATGHIPKQPANAALQYRTTNGPVLRGKFNAKFQAMQIKYPKLITANTKDGKPKHWCKPVLIDDNWDGKTYETKAGKDGKDIYVKISFQKWTADYWKDNLTEAEREVWRVRYRAAIRDYHLAWDKWEVEYPKEFSDYIGKCSGSDPRVGAAKKRRQTTQKRNATLPIRADPDMHHNAGLTQTYDNIKLSL